MDLVLQVKDSANVSGSVTYNNYCTIGTGDLSTMKMIKVYAKDQLVVQDYAQNLSFRVGPNGHMYTGDMSSYSLRINDNHTGAISNNFVPIYNSDVNLF
jgi:hypothetical protein